MDYVLKPIELYCVAIELYCEAKSFWEIFCFCDRTNRRNLPISVPPYKVLVSLRTTLYRHYMVKVYQIVPESPTGILGWALADEEVRPGNPIAKGTKVVWPSWVAEAKFHIFYLVRTPRTCVTDVWTRLELQIGGTRV